MAQIRYSINQHEIEILYFPRDMYDIAIKE